jgi:hypothetical protein
VALLRHAAMSAVRSLSGAKRTSPNVDQAPLHSGPGPEQDTNGLLKVKPCYRPNSLSPCDKSGFRASQIYFACSCASNNTFRVPSSNNPVVDFGFRSDPSMGVSVSIGGLYATGVGRSSPDVSSVSSISSEFRTMPVDRSWMRLFRLSIFFGLGGGV